MQRLIAAQSVIGKTISQLLENFRKENIERRTIENTKGYEGKLNDLWTNFCQNHDQIIESEDCNKEHSYFVKNYFNQVEKIYNEFVQRLSERLEVSSATSSHTDEPEHHEELVPMTGSLKMRKRFKATIAALERIIKVIEREHADPHPRAYYTQKLRSINQYWDTIASLHGQIMAELDDDSYNIREYTKIEDLFQETATRLQGKLDEQSVTTINGNVKLPKLTLPIFDGNYTKWGQFKDLYSQLIHNRPLGGAEKLYYLKANLTGEPSGLIKHLQATDDNYSVAWKLLLERYDNPRAIVTAILNQLLYQAVLTTESGSGIKRLHDISKECLLALENSGIEIKQWNPILLHLLTQKLDKESRRLYEQSLKAPHELQTMDDFFKFMETRFQMLEVIQTKEERKRVSTLTASSQVAKCAVCKADHGVFRCPKFLYASLDNRIQLIRQFKLCPNCLKVDHTVHDCTSRGCMKCGKRHNTLIHNPRQSEKPRNFIQAKSRQGIVHRSTDSAPMNYQQMSRGSSGATRQLDSTSQFQEISRSTPSETTSSQISSLQASTRSQILLATAIIKVINASGVPVNCRVLLDSGSQLHFICERLVQALGLSRSKTSLPISGVGGIATTAKYETTLTIHSRVKSFSAVINAVILKNISEHQPSQYIKTSNWDIPTSIQLADPAFYKPQAIDMLLGAELFFQLLQEGQIRLHNLPLLQNTHFGWILAGRLPTQAGCSQSCHIATQPSVSALDKQLQQFWELEHHDSPSKYKSREELLCEEHFQNTFQRSASGQYIVKLPFREQPTTLGSSLEIASKRFYALERKLERNPDLKRQYHDFMTEYQKLGHMQPIPKEAIPTDHYYMPHHCVAKADTNKPKFRVVFDASAKTSTGRSLNDILMVGPTVQPDLFTIITKFRMYKYAMTADICKMYRQINVHPNDRKYQLILWRDDREKSLQTYQLNTVTYGTAAAPFLATRCLNQLALAEYDTFPEAANMILGNTYVDDILTGADSKQSMLKLKNDLTELLKGGGFELRKFCANHPDTLRNVPEDHREKMLLIDNGEVTKTLGLIWQTKEDSFQYQATEGETQGFTKRTVLSEVARIFDPLGLIGPVTVLGKLLLQDLWKAKCSWDEELPTVHKNKWMKFKKSLPGLRAIKIPRHVLFSNSVNIQLHAFSDSSESSYGACCYLRSVNRQGEIRVRLLCAKSRLAPLKATTLARLELCAALLMTELVERVSQCTQINPSRIVYHTDSTIVLAWISSPSYTWSTFIAHRVEKIQHLTQPQQWRHIEGTQNPADIISRGMFPDALSQSTLWFKGPKYLSEPEEKWPTFAFKIPDEIPEAKPKKSVFTAIERVKHVDLVTSVNHCNSFLKLQRIFAYCFRFLQNCKSPKGSRKMGEVSIAELDIALNGIIKNIQRTAFQHEYSSLKKGEAIDSHHSLQHLTPFIDASTGIIKVGGRLKNSELSQDAKNQILLPKDHKLSELLFNYLHNQHMHAAPQALTAIARQKYWVIDARRLARHTVHRCIRCFRCKPKPVDQMMGDLPVERVKPTRPFHTTGVDFCGPIMIHYKLRGKAPTKAYIAVFVCFTTKAVHLELVSDLSAEAFLNALKRFIARRGVCATIFCDNATNFLGARTHLKELKDMLLSQDLQSSLAQLCIKNHIEWKPIPPRSPHFGGLWEAAVKSAKNHLIRQTGNANLTYEELHTVIVQIEAILNSRPITPMSSDPNDLEALTPGHFLTGSPLTACAEADVAERDIDKLTRFRRIQHIQQTFWQRWSAEYLQELQTRNKWRSIKPNLKPGTLVVIREANLPPLKWSLGRVIETFDGADKLTRVVSVKTPSGIFKRTIHNLCPLPDEQYRPDDLKGNASGTNLGNDSKSVQGAQPITSFLTLNQVPGPSHKDVEGEPPAKRMKHKRPYHPLRGRFLPINSN